MRRASWMVLDLPPVHRLTELITDHNVSDICLFLLFGDILRVSVDHIFMKYTSYGHEKEGHMLTKYNILSWKFPGFPFQTLCSWMRALTTKVAPQKLFAWEVIADSGEKPFKHLNTSSHYVWAIVGNHVDEINTKILKIKDFLQKEYD